MSLTVENKKIGRGEKALLIAEVSANHDRDLDHALKLVDIAADAGWDCLKLQTYNADTLTVPSTHPSMKVDPIWGKDTLYELYDDAGMPMEFHEPLFARARERSLLPFTSIYDPRDLDYIEGLGCEIYKIASFEMTFDDLLIAVASTKKPVILATGMANMAEIAHALEVLDKHGSGEVILLHCCSAYPAPLQDINLKAMQNMEKTFGRMTGFSDHTIGSIGPLTAIAMGAVAIEKHYTSDPNRTGPDHRFSATPDVMKEIAIGAQQIHEAMGTGEKMTRSSEEANKSVGRRSAFSVKALSQGHVITESDFRFVRPSAGIPANDKAGILGKTLRRNIGQYEPITYDDVD
ncbi:MAG: N-acetylneuraminate synthase family protein [Halocynthiibacter sp.]